MADNNLSDRDNAIVDEMMYRLRATYSVQDAVPLTRRIHTTGYLVGGGALSEDLTIALDEDARRLLDLVKNNKWATYDDVDEVVARVLTPPKPRIWVRDFSFFASGMNKVVYAPPIAVGRDSRLRNIVCAVDKGGVTPQVSVTGGKSWYLSKDAPGTWSMNAPYKSGDVINMHLKLPNNDVGSGTVSLFFEED
ncbi:hypothetical protein KUS72_005274 [Escherichia coli]|nr:hypothetical protein [Escherichia coli]